MTSSCQDLVWRMLTQLPSTRVDHSVPNASQCSCGNAGDGLQEVLEAAPYYLLGQNTVPVDVLQLSPQSVNVTVNTAQGVFHSANYTTNTALITLMVSSMTQ